jgi:hypothetical protein
MQGISGESIRCPDAGSQVRRYCWEVEGMKESDTTRSDSRIGRRKTEVREALQSSDIDTLLKSKLGIRKLLRALSSLLYDRDRIICFRAVHALGKVSGEVAKRDPSRIQNLLRRLLWTMNDESGSICWYAPEAIGEVLVSNPQFRREFSLILLSFIKEEPFEAGVHRALFRIAESDPTAFPAQAARFERSLDDTDASIRGHALLIYRVLNARPPNEKIRRALEDQCEFQFFNHATLKFEARKISEIAQHFEQSPK